MATFPLDNSHVQNNDSEASHEDDGRYDERYDDYDDLAGIAHRHTETLGVNTKYAQDWDRGHGFREFAQNW